jgi:hypothetical protein
MRRVGIGRWSTGNRFGSVVENVVALMWNGHMGATDGKQHEFRKPVVIREMRRRLPTYQETWDAYVAFHRIAAYSKRVPYIRRMARFASAAPSGSGPAATGSDTGHDDGDRGRSKEFVRGRRPQPSRRSATAADVRAMDRSIRELLL